MQRQKMDKIRSAASAATKLVPTWKMAEMEIR